MEKIKQIFSYNKRKYECMLDDPNSKLGSFLDRIILAVVLFFPLVLIFESIGNNAYIYITQIYIIEAIISIIFASEYFYRFFKAKNKIRSLFHPMRIIDLLSFLPFFLGFINFGNYLKVLRILRVFKILRLFRKNPLTSSFINALEDYRDEYKAVFTLYFIILFLCSFFVYYAEKSVVGSDFNSILDALWWGLVTTTTVGYGDMIIHTSIGKTIGSILVFIGPLLGGLISAVTIMVFMESSKEQEHKLQHRRGKACERCKTKNQNAANYCMMCGKKLNYEKIIDSKISNVVN